MKKFSFKTAFRGAFPKAALLLGLFGGVAFAVSSMMASQPLHEVETNVLGTNVVISQVYGGAGSTGATYKNDYIELYNPSTTSVNLSGWTVQYAASTGKSWQATPLSGTIAPGSYFLIQEGSGTGNSNLPVTPDVIGSIQMSGTAGKVALVKSTTKYTVSCSTKNRIDFVGYGSGTNCYESAPTANLSITTAALRNGNGAIDTDNNKNDFTIGTPNPRTGGSTPPADTAPSVSTTTPAQGATDIGGSSNISVAFSEAVAVAGQWYSLSCSASGSHTATVTGGPTTYTIDPGSDFVSGDICTFKVLAAQVTDTDTIDPPNNMVADYTLTFTVDTAPSVSSTTPAQGAADVAVSSNVAVTFSEAVAVAGQWYDLNCSTSGSHTAAVTGGPTTYTVNPDTDFTVGDSCTFKVLAAQVTDADANDPPDNMVADYTLTFAVADPCMAGITHIHDIQGSGSSAALTGTRTTCGVVVGDYEGSAPALRGFYMQDPTPDGDPATSDGIFVFDSGSNLVNVGDKVRVSGTVTEYNGLTELSSPTVTKYGTGTITPTDLTLPLASATDLERFEGMLVRMPQTLTVTEQYLLGRYGQVLLSSGGRLKQPTNVATPGSAALALQAQNDLNHIILDDSFVDQNHDPIIFGGGTSPLSASNTLRGGYTVTNTVGVLGYLSNGNTTPTYDYAVLPTNALNGYVNFVADNARPSSVANVGGNVKVAGMNLLNFFKSISSCYPSNTVSDCRGADTQAEFDRQWPKTVAAIIGTGADVIGVTELENNGYGSTSSIAFLVDKLNAATAAGTYAYVNVNNLAHLGTDAIAVGMLYKPGVVTPVGTTAVLDSAAFVNGGDSTVRNRVTFAQAFELNGTSKRFVATVNHLKSKGSACDTADAGDGQGECNVVRTNAMNALISWLATDPTGTGETDNLIIGDLNAYAKEDPITAAKNAGYSNLVESLLGLDAYSYVFDGQWGYLDHALASPSLASQVSGVADYHINADEPLALDYNVEFKSTAQQSLLYAADKYRAADHDPVVIGINLQ